MLEFLRCSWAFFRRDAELAVSYPVAFALGIAGTVGQILVLWLPAQLLAESRLFAAHGGFMAFAVVGTAMMGFFMASYGSFSNAIRGEQAMGTLESVLMTPASAGALIVGSSSFGMLRALTDAALMLGASALLYGVSLHGSPLDVLLLLVLNDLAFVAVGIFSAAFTVLFKRGDPFRVLVGGASFLLGGVLYPTEVLPGWLRGLAELMPITHGARALRGVLLEGRSLGEVLPDAAFVGVFAVSALGVGVLAFSFAIRRAKRDGSLLQY